MLKSHSKLFVFSALAIVPLAAIPLRIGLAQSANRSAPDAQVSITPRTKPSVKEEVLPKADIRVNTTLVLIPVTVTDPLNRFVTGLEKENFKILEDKVEQSISQFSSEDAPL